MSGHEQTLTTPNSPSRAKPTIRWRIIRCLILLVLVLSLYVLSIGPMWWSWYSGMYLDTRGKYWVIALYEPLRQVCQIELIDDWVTAYIEWWNS